MLHFIRYALAALALLAAPTVIAQGAYPVKPIKFVAPFPPGGSSDVLSRLIGQKLAETLGQPVTVENRGGAAGNIGSEYVAKQPADGYTILLGSSVPLATNVHLYKRMGFDPLNDFTPIGMIAVAGSVLVVHPSVPVNSVAELVSHLKANPGKLNYGSGGTGTPAHLIAEAFKTAMGVSMVHVPYKGTGVAVVDLVAGQVNLIFSDMVPTVPQIRAGKLRPLAVTLEKRSPALPDLPTLSELGVNIKTGETWWSIMGPKGVPDAVVQRLNSDLEKILKMPDVLERYAQLSISPHHSSPQGVVDRIKRDTPEFGKVLQAAGIQPE